MLTIKESIDHIQSNKEITNKERVIFRSHFNSNGVKLNFLKEQRSKENDNRIVKEQDSIIKKLENERAVLKPHANIVPISVLVSLTKDYVNMNPNSFTDKDYLMIEAIQENVNNYLWFYRGKTKNQKQNKRDNVRYPCFKHIPFKETYKKMYDYVYNIERILMDLTEYQIWDTINGLTINRDRLRYLNYIEQIEIFYKKDHSEQLNSWSKL